MSSISKLAEDAINCRRSDSDFASHSALGR